jgi:hypothetical protein
MAMTDAAREAFDELLAIGAPVRDWGEEEGYGDHVAFVLIWANEDTSQVFVDNTRKYIKEDVIDGRYVNPMGYRQDIHEILAKHDLVSAWEGGGHIVIYNDPDAIGIRHNAEWMWNPDYKPPMPDRVR